VDIRTGHEAQNILDVAKEMTETRAEEATGL